MSNLTARDRELVALGAALGSNCVPCIEYHIPESRKVGLTDLEILAAIHHADKIRQVPAGKVLQAALKMLPSATGTGDDAEDAGTSEPGLPRAMTKGIMSQMMDACSSADQAAGGAAPFSRKGPSPSPGPANEGGCC